MTVAWGGHASNGARSAGKYRFRVVAHLPGRNATSGYLHVDVRTGFKTVVSAESNNGVDELTSTAPTMSAATATGTTSSRAAPTACRTRRLLDGLPSIRLESIRAQISPTGYLLADYRVLNR